MFTKEIIKRNGDRVIFDPEKITRAIMKGMKSTDVDVSNAQEVTAAVCVVLDRQHKEDENYTPTVEEVQDMVEDQLMELGFHETAKAYILYRSSQNNSRKKDLFKKRTNVKPYEYPELLEFVDAIRHSYWIHTEFNYDGDVQHFKVDVNDVERNAIKNSMLAIAQIEVAVKTFWGDMYAKMPKPEIGAVGATFAESEVRHTDAYSHLLEILGINGDFEKLLEVPAIRSRIVYLEKALAHTHSDQDEEYAFTVALFSIFVENVSLFSQFLVMMSFNKHKNLFKGLSNAVEATSKEEDLHGKFGTTIINILQEERPEWFGEGFSDRMYELCQEAFDAESGIIDWIFEAGELDFLPKKTVVEFIKDRFNTSLKNIGLDPLFDTDISEVEKTDWFNDEIITTKHGDFFDKRAINYNKKSKSVTADDLF